MIAPPFTRPFAFMCVGVIFISPVTFFAVSEVTLMPSAATMPLFMTGVVLASRCAGSALGFLRLVFDVAFLFILFRGWVCKTPPQSSGDGQQRKGGLGGKPRF